MGGGGRKRRDRRKRNPLELAAGFVLLVIVSVVFVIAAPFVWLFKKIRGQSSRNLAILGGLAALFLVSVVIALVYWANTRVNAVEVYLDGRKLGVVSDLSITAETLFERAMAKLSAKEGVPVSVVEQVTVKRVHGKARADDVEYVVGKIYTEFTYTVLAAEIYVDGKKLAVVKTRADADAVIKQIKDKFYQEGLNIDSVEFVENVDIRDSYIDRGEVGSNESALNILSADKSAETIYEVQEGDTIWKISNDTGLSMEAIYALNPQLDNDPTKLRARTLITIATSVPVVSVQTKELTEFYETVKMGTETRNNDGEPRSHSRVIQQGRDGRKRVKAYIIRENGLEVGREIIDEVIEVEPVTQIVEVGTK